MKVNVSSAAAVNAVLLVRSTVKVYCPAAPAVVGLKLKLTEAGPVASISKASDHTGVVSLLVYTFTLYCECEVLSAHATPAAASIRREQAVPAFRSTGVVTVTR